ncbi:MAG: hypothetical protein FWB74_00715 [Defluviitaleaceae bacterium]|nr:hypothetical protein [Defluviitaleaceae bacterium]
MAIETKMLISVLLDAVAKSTTVEEAYKVLANAASVEGVNVPTYDEAVKMNEEMRKKAEKN